MQYRRLKKNNQFNILFKKGKKVFSPYLTILYIPSNGNVMGIALSKKHGKAVVRNRIKRLIRAAYADNLSAIPFACNMVILPKVQQEYSYAAFCKGLVSCFGRMKR